MDSRIDNKKYSDYKGKNIIITGGTGGIGILLIKRLLQLEANIYAFVRKEIYIRKNLQ